MKAKVNQMNKKLDTTTNIAIEKQLHIISSRLMGNFNAHRKSLFGVEFVAVKES